MRLARLGPTDPLVCCLVLRVGGLNEARCRERALQVREDKRHLRSARTNVRACSPARVLAGSSTIMSGRRFEEETSELGQCVPRVMTRICVTLGGYGPMRLVRHCVGRCRCEGGLCTRLSRVSSSRAGAGLHDKFSTPRIPILRDWTRN